MNLLSAETPLWAYLAAVAFVAAVSWSVSWIKDHYEFASGRPVRRWYGTGAWVTLCRGYGTVPERYAVRAWSGDATTVPWLLVSSIDGEEAFWAAVTDFAPEAVRMFHPHLRHLGWLPVPVLTARETYQGRPS